MSFADLIYLDILKNLRIAEINKLDMKVENGTVVGYRARVSVSFKYGSE